MGQEDRKEIKYQSSSSYAAQAAYITTEHKPGAQSALRAGFHRP